MSTITMQEWPGRITISDPVTLINEIARRYERRDALYRCFQS